MATNLYRHFDKNGVRLYVGVSLDAFKRLRQHQGNAAAWFDEIANVTVEKFITCSEALKAKRASIRKEAPKFNSSHSLTGVGSMTANQYRAAIKLGLTQGAAAAFLGVSIRASNSYANGAPIPKGYAKLLRLMVRLNLTPKDMK